MRTSLAHLPKRRQAVFTDDRPKLHDLHKLRKRVGELDRRVLKGFAHHTSERSSSSVESTDD